MISYDATVKTVVPFVWPIDHRGDRVPPALFAAYRSTHHFANPTCFCPIGLDSDAAMINKETAIYRPTEGPYQNQILAACATDTCLYLVPLRSFYHAANIPVKYYPRRIDGDKSPLPILHASLMQLPTIPDAEDWAPTELMDSDSGESLSDCGDMDMSDFATELKEIAGGAHRLQQPTATAAHIRRPLALPSTLIPVFNQPLTAPPSLGAMMQTMDAAIRPGVNLDDFLSSVSLCECGLVLSSFAFPIHKCINEPSEAIEYHPSDILRLVDATLNRDLGIPLKAFCCIVAQCPCGMIVTRRAFLAHECQRNTLRGVMLQCNSLST